MTPAAWVAAASGLLLLYPWTIFPLLLWIWPRPRSRATSAAAPSGERWPMVSVIVAARDEADHIEARLADIEGQDYPPDRLEVVVGSDASTDGTDALLDRRERGRIAVVHFRLAERGGRAAVHNAAVPRARGEILVFSDAETAFAPDVIRRLVGRLADPRLGCGSADLSWRGRPETVGAAERRYWSLEKRLRLLEDRAGVLPFASGACLAARRELFEPLPPESDVDNVLPLRCIERGYRVFYEPAARARDEVVTQSGQLFRRRVRIATRSLADILRELPRLWRAGRCGAIWALVSHRLLRWCQPVLWTALLAANLALVGGAGWDALLLAQLLVLAAAGAGWLLEQATGRPGPLAAPLGLVAANAAFLVALGNVARGVRVRHYAGATGAREARHGG